MGGCFVNIARARLDLKDGRTVVFEEKISDADLSRLNSTEDLIRGEAGLAFLDKAVEQTRTDIDEIHSYRLEVSPPDGGLIARAEVTAVVSEEPAPARGRVERCHSILRLANLVLPPRVRGEALDEWIDEIECAAAEKKPVLRRTLSIVFRSLPSLALRARLPARARREGGA